MMLVVYWIFRLLRWVAGFLLLLLVAVAFVWALSWALDRWGPRPAVPAPLVTPTPTAEQPGSVQAEPAAAVQLEESEVLTPQGLLLEDGSFLWQDLGSVGHWLNADGDLWCRGERPNDRVTDFVIFPGGSISLRFWQGTLYQYRQGIGFQEALGIVVSRNAPDKFNTSPVHTARVWRASDETLEHLVTIRETGRVEGARAACEGGLVLGDVRFGAPSVQTSAAPSVTTAGFPSSTSQAASTFGVSGHRSARADQWEGCPGETACWHLRDGPSTRVNVPSGTSYEGWDGSRTIRGSGPAAVAAVGVTIRPR